MFQLGFDATTEDHLGWDEFGYSDILATMDAPQAAEEVGPSQFTQAPPVGTQPTQAVGGATPTAGEATPVGAGSSLVGEGTPTGGAIPAGGATPDVVGLSQAAMATPSPDQLGPWVVRAPDPRRMPRTTHGLALELLGPKRHRHI
jgi:hypothetical protein